MYRMKSGGAGRKCVRWNPSSEQVRVLTELFKCGLRTPTTDQIRKISLQLSVYGEIESKNVFYWFQNHKARERHKRRPRVSVDERNNKFSSSTKCKYTHNRFLFCMGAIELSLVNFSIAQLVCLVEVELELS